MLMLRTGERPAAAAAAAATAALLLPWQPTPSPVLLVLVRLARAFIVWTLKASGISSIKAVFADVTRTSKGRTQRGRPAAASTTETHSSKMLSGVGVLDPKKCVCNGVGNCRGS
jgi:hypothetical protein